MLAVPEIFEWWFMILTTTTIGLCEQLKMMMRMEQLRMIIFDFFFLVLFAVSSHQQLFAAIQCKSCSRTLEAFTEILHRGFAQLNRLCTGWRQCEFHPEKCSTSAHFEDNFCHEAFITRILCHNVAKYFQSKIDSNLTDDDLLPVTVLDCRIVFWGTKKKLQISCYWLILIICKGGCINWFMIPTKPPTLNSCKIEQLKFEVVFLVFNLFQLFTTLECLIWEK